jgi:hypothetical protein
MVIDIELIFKSFLLIIISIGALAVVLSTVLIPIVFAWAVKGAEDHNVV